MEDSKPKPSTTSSSRSKRPSASRKHKSKHKVQHPQPKPKPKKQKPLKIDISSLLNHHRIIQKSIPHLHGNVHPSTAAQTQARPDVQMVHFQSATYQDWYILTASTPHAISAQLISIPLAKDKKSDRDRDNNNNDRKRGARSGNNNHHKDDIPDVVVPDFVQCTPISVWTSTSSQPKTKKSKHPLEDSDDDDHDNDDDDNGETFGKDPKQSSSQMEFETLSCKPSILIRTPPPPQTSLSSPSSSGGGGMGENISSPLNSDQSSSSYLQVSILCGLNSSRLLSVQLSIYAYIGMQGCENRFVLSKNSGTVGIHSGNHSGGMNGGGVNGNSGIVEPLPVDTEEDVIRMKMALKRKTKLQQQPQHLQHPGTSGGDGSSGPSSKEGMHWPLDAPSASSSSSTTHDWVPFQPKGGVISISPPSSSSISNSVTSGGEGGIRDPLGRKRLQSRLGEYSVAESALSTFVWITYGDGTFVRMPHWSFFSCMYGDMDHGDGGIGGNRMVHGGERDNGHVVDDLDHPIHHGRDLTFRGRLDWKQMQMRNGGGVVSSGGSMSMNYTVVPLPRCFPTLLSQPPDMPISAASVSLPDISFDDDALGVEGFEEDDDDDEDNVYDEEEFDHNGAVAVRKERVDLNHHEFFEAICYRAEWSEAATASTADSYPTLSFYTNENQLFSNMHKPAKDDDTQMSTVQNIIRGGTTIIGGTAALAKTMLGGMMGVLGRSKPTVLDEEDIKGMEIRGASSRGHNSIMEEDDDVIEPSNRTSSLFPALHKRPTSLSLGSAIYDAPRRITHVSIDPSDGKLMACADNLGRVQLIDLDIKEPIRMWKGFRDASCHWIQLPYTINDEIHRVKYLAIHSRQRNVVEIFRMNHGPRVSKFDVKSDGVSLVQCPVNLRNGDTFIRNFEVRISKSSNKSSILKEVRVEDEELIVASRRRSNSLDLTHDRGGFLSHARAQEGSIQMQLLKQLLASESAVPSDLDGVYDALTQITTLSDLSKALDLLGLATHLQNMGVSDSSFHSEVVLHAREQLDVALSDKAIATSKNAHIHELNTKIDFHTQLILAFDEIHAFESLDRKGENLQLEEESPTTNSWIAEASGWIETHEKVSGYNIDSDLPVLVESQLTLATFAKGCLQGVSNLFQRNKDKTLKLYLCDSTRDRKQILLHLFKPLTEDIFTLKIVHEVFEHMGIAGDFNTLLQYFGEWFMSLPKDVIEKQCGDISCPAVRWLRDIVAKYLNSDTYEKSKEEGECILLQALYEFCSEAEDLPRAFALSVVCYEAILAATKNIEDQTYGLKTSEDFLLPWRDLLRKIRLCQLISLRLYGINVGALPITVSNIDAGNVFALHQFIAHDELSLTQNTRDIVELELACIASPFAFSPSLEEGDTTNNWQMLQVSCSKRHDAKNFVLDDGLGPAPLLFFLQHYYDTVKLASHRALILAQKWGREPHSLQFLDDTLSTLRSIESVTLLSAVSQEIWNNYLRPIYRGVLFGFHEAHEICEDIISPLCGDPIWFASLNKLSTELIVLLRSTVDGLSIEYEENAEENGDKVWPPLQKDIILENLMRRSGKLDDSSLEIHSAIVCAIQLTNSMESLTTCFPTLDILFLRESFTEHQHVSLVPNDQQSLFIDTALKMKVDRFVDSTVSYADLDDIVTLGRAWGMEKSKILTEFILVMYEVGKDDLIQHLVSSTRLIEIERFSEGGMLIACVRLEAALATLKKAKQCRSILAMLDADTCEWVKEQAEINMIEKPEAIYTHDSNGKLISLEHTQELILRIKRISPANRIDANALSVMCETLLQAAEVFN